MAVRPTLLIRILSRRAIHCSSNVDDGHQSGTGKELDSFKLIVGAFQQCSQSIFPLKLPLTKRENFSDDGRACFGSKRVKRTWWSEFERGSAGTTMWLGIALDGQRVLKFTLRVWVYGTAVTECNKKGTVEPFIMTVSLWVVGGTVDISITEYAKAGCEKTHYRLIPIIE